MAKEYSADIITLLDDDGSQHEFEVLDAIETDDGRYVALLPVAADGQEPDSEYYILQVIDMPDGTNELAEIEDEELLDTLADVFEGRFDELYGDE
ncbi:MAG: DUF1292 domain-containing protein [Oscillospiraceae bacterium]|nr:DUF1292 domain-containing protein [Oscillospiraceae bacterium]